MPENQLVEISAQKSSILERGMMIYSLPDSLIFSWFSVVLKASIYLFTTSWMLVISLTKNFNIYKHSIFANSLL